MAEVEPSINVAAPADQHESLTEDIVNELNVDAELEISKVLQVDEKSEINGEVNKSTVPEKEIKPTKFVPGAVKTRAALIQKIQETAEIVGNEADVKSMRLHRRRRNSLDTILKEQITKCVHQEAEKRMGIPPADDTEGRLAYAVEMLYNFDLCCCKLVERIVDYCDLGATCEGFSETIDKDPRIRSEIKRSFADWIKENDNMQWLETAASPSTRLLLCHLYPLMSVLRAKTDTHKKQEIPPEVKMGLLGAKLRSAVDPPRLPKQMKLV